MTEQEILGRKVLTVICLLAAIGASTLIISYLFRSWKRQQISIFSFYGSESSFARSSNPLGFWFSFWFYVVLAVAFVYGIFHNAYLLWHGVR